MFEIFKRILFEIKTSIELENFVEMLFSFIIILSFEIFCFNYKIYY